MPTYCYKHIQQNDVNQEPILGRFMKIKQRKKSRANVPLNYTGYCKRKRNRKTRSETKRNEKKFEAKRSEIFPLFFRLRLKRKVRSENMQNFHFIFQRKIAKTKRNGLRFASRCEITKQKKEAKRAHPISGCTGYYGAFFLLGHRSHYCRIYPSLNTCINK